MPYDIFDYPSYWEGREYEDRSDKLAIFKFLKKIEDRESLIDIAGGFGRLSRPLAKEFAKILLVDQSEGLIKEAKKYLANFKNIEIKKGNCQKLPVASGSFSAALMVRIVHHLNEPEKALREARRVLKPGGFLILEFANKIHFLACLKAVLSGNFGFRGSLEPVEKRSEEAIKEEMITFKNCHPQAIENSLERIGFRIIDRLSVSNCRFLLLKRIIPLSLLLLWENLTQRLFARFYFGPSIYLLAQKT